MTPSEKVAYLKGLIEGMEYDMTTKEGKILDRMIDILEDLAFGLEDAEDNTFEIGEELDQLSDDLADVEAVVFGGADYDPAVTPDAPCCGGCCGYGYSYDGSEGAEDEDEEEYTIVCPSCNQELIVTDAEVESGKIICPNCSATLDLEYEDEEPEED